MRHAKEIRENVVDYSCWSEGRVVLELIVCQKSLAPVYLELHDDLQVTGRQEVAFFLICWSVLVGGHSGVTFMIMHIPS